MPCSRSPGEGVCSWGVPGPGESAPRGVWPSIMAFWYGGLLIEGGLLAWSSGGQKVITEGHHTRRPLHQKATWGAWWRPPQTATAAGGTHPTGMHSCCD